MKYTKSKAKRYDQIRMLVQIKKLAQETIEELSDQNSPESGVCQNVVVIAYLLKELNSP